MLTPRQSFNFGFLARCAEEGLSPEATQHRIKSAHAVLDARIHEKQAAIGPAANTTGSLLGAVPGLAWKLGLLGLPLAGLAGAGIGYAAAGGGDPEIPDAQAMKDQELMQSYRRHAAMTRHATERRRKRTQARRTPAFPRLV